MAVQLTQQNDMADWVLLVEYSTTEQAMAAAASWNGGDASDTHKEREGAHDQRVQEHQAVRERVA